MVPKTKLSDCFPQSSMAALGRIQPFLPRGTFQASIALCETLDAVLSKAGRKQLLTKPHHRGASSRQNCSQTLTLPPARSGLQPAKDFSPHG